VDPADIAVEAVVSGQDLETASADRLALKQAGDAQATEITLVGPLTQCKSES
jgi:hypothetical protein